ncbi:AAA family ATPase [Thiocystis violacea]|uniref:AAA family ATPase n=1 Tax=Thiocystis violacea TaxID=13725 RepID=UPI0019089FE3|nr:AAA family ATPase [Thiocystis violacea]MBK1718499.1 sporulation protein [Thiocystis violacea]
MPLDPDCLVRLKLRQEPFDAVPSEDFLYSDPLLESLIETAARALAASGAIVILAGADGSGRSIQLMRLLGALNGRYELIAFRGRPNIPFDAVDVTIRAHLRAGGFDNPNQSVTDLLVERARARAKLVLAIDDAHFLGSDSILQLLRMRSAILEAGGQGLRLVLVGDQTLNRGRLPLPDPSDDNQVVRLNLRPFNLEQSGAYLRHRLRVAGLDDPDALLTSGDIAVLQTSSKGIPAVLNLQANAWLTRRCKSTGGFNRTLTGKLVAPAVKTGAGVSRPAAPVAEPPPLDDEPGYEPPEGILDLEADTYQPSGYAPADPQLSDFLVADGERSEAADFDRILQRVREHQQGQGVEPESKAATRTEIQSNAPKAPYWSRPWFIPVLLGVVLIATLMPVAFRFIGQSETPPRLAPALPEPTPAIPLETSPEAPLPIEQTPVPSGSESVENAMVEEADGAPASAATPDEGTGQEVPAEVDGEVSADPVTPVAPTAPESTTDLKEDLDWLMRQDPERFTLQLVAARDLATARTFIEPHGLEGIHYIQTRRYVIAVFGSFPSRAQATRVLPDLPNAVRENGPWIRTIGSIRETLL